MDYLLVAFMKITDSTGSYYNFETVAEYRTMTECEYSLRRAINNGTTKMVSLVCAKRDWN